MFWLIWFIFIQLYISLQTSPDVFCPKDRTRDIEAIHQVIQSAQSFVFISVTDYLPLVNRSFRGTTVTRYGGAAPLHSRPKLLSFKWTLQQVLVADRWCHQRGCGPKTGSGPPAGQLLDKDSPSHLQLPHLTEVSVLVPAQLLPGGGMWLLVVILWHTQAQAQTHTHWFSATVVVLCRSSLDSENRRVEFNWDSTTTST